MQFRANLTVTLTVLAVLLLALMPTTWAQMHENHKMAMHDEMGMNVTKAIAVLQPTQGNDVRGTVTFTQSKNGVLVEAVVTGLTPGKHGFHIHEFGDCSAPDGTSAGGHFNPTDHPHAGPADETRHVGDLGNLIADDQGNAEYRWIDPKMSLHGPTSILGRGVIVHAGEDDLHSQPTGAAGARVACGVIGVAKDGVE